MLRQNTFKRFISNTRVIRNSENRWSELITAYTPKENLDFFNTCERKLAQTITSANKVSKDMKTINWNDYAKKIKNKKVFNQIKKDYENHVFEKVPLSSDGNNFNQYVTDFKSIHQEDSIKRKKQIDEFKKELETVENDSKDFVNWTIQDIYKKYPGIEEQWREEYLLNRYFTTEDEEKLAATDLKTLFDAMKNGEEPDLELPNIQLGDISIKDEKKNKMVNLIKLIVNIVLQLHVIIIVLKLYYKTLSNKKIFIYLQLFYMLF